MSNTQWHMDQCLQKEAALEAAVIKLEKTHLEYNLEIVKFDLDAKTITFRYSDESDVRNIIRKYTK